MTSPQQTARHKAGRYGSVAFGRRPELVEGFTPDEILKTVNKR
jgi:hypothetical protein